MDRGIAIVAALCALLSFERLDAQDAEGETRGWSDDVVAVARLCVSERSFAHVEDCRVIAGIVARNARAAGVSPAEYVATRHPHHTDAERSKRPWVAALSADVDAVPAGWPEGEVPWSPRGRTAWLATLREARDALAAPRGCRGGFPSTWGGRVDAERLARMTGPSGSYRVVDCGHTANVFVARRPEGR